MALDPQLFQGLSDFGLSQPSQSSSVDNSFGGGGLQDLLGSNAILDEAAKSKVLDEAIAQAQGQPSPSLTDQLKSPGGLLALLGTIAAGAVGGAPAAAGFGLGSLSGASAATEAKAAQQRKAIDELIKQRDESQKRLADSQTRMATIFNTNPEAFVDPATGEQKIPPEVLGFYMTGTPTEIFATSRRAANRRDTLWDKRYELLTKRLETAPTLDDRKAIVGSLFRLLDFPQDPALAESLAAAPPDKFPVDLANMYMKYGGETGLNAIIQAGEQGLPLYDPRIAKLIQYRDPDNAGKTTPSDRFLQLAQEINAWSSDPANLDRMREIRQENEQKGEGAISIAIAREVLGGRRGDFDTYMHEASLRGPDELAAIQANLKQQLGQYSLGIGMAGIDKLPFIQNMTDEERAAWFWQNAQAMTDAQQQQARDERAKQDLQLGNDIAGRIRKELTTGSAEANQFAKEILGLALTRATRPDGSVDWARYEQEARKITDETIKGALAE